VVRFLEIVWNAVMTPNGRRNVLYRWRRWRLRTFTALGSGSAAVYRLRGGQRFVAHPNDQLSEQISSDRCYEPLESRVIASVLGPGDVAVDIGANIGYYSALSSARVGPRGLVHAFEPGPATFIKLQKTIELLGLENVKAYPLALANRSGSFRFVTSTSGQDAQQSLADWGGFQGEKDVANVETSTLDDFLDCFVGGGHPAFVKCDVEGAEPKVLEGSYKTLQGDSPPVIMLEANRKALSAQGASADELLEKLPGYRFYFTPLDSNNETMRRFRTADELPELANLIAFPERGVFGARIAEAARYLDDGGK
jgi:FkbM family methyltransferase